MQTVYWLILFVILLLAVLVFVIFKGDNSGEEIHEKSDNEFDMSIFKKYKEIEQVILFGSRARQDNKYNSDIDLCLFGEKITHLIQAKVTMDIEEVNTPLSFDILNFNELTKEKLIENIKNEGIIIYKG